MKPNFLIIGAPRAGTTSLWVLLDQHPEIAVSKPKEPRFFCHDDKYARGWRWYESFFSHAADAKAVVDVSPGYSIISLFPETPARIAKHLPDAKLIYIVRDPLRRVESTYLQCLYAGRRMPRSFSRAVRTYAPIVASGRYWTCISSYLRHFTEEQFHLAFFEDFERDPGDLLAGICRFLGVDDGYAFADASCPRNTAGEHYVERESVKYLGRFPAVAALARALPAAIRKRLRCVLYVPLTQRRPEWDHDTREWVLSHLRDEAVATLRYGGKRLDYWDLEP